MPAFQINDEEWRALVEEPGDVFLVYCAIRRVMDFATGVAGARRRISEQMISEVLYITPTRGRHESGSPSRQRVRSVLDRLIKLSVLIPIGPMVYELPLADRDSASKRSATDEQPDQQPHQQPNDNQLDASDCGASEGKSTLSATGSGSGETGNSNLPPVSGNNTSTGNARGAFAMTLDGWEPDPRTFKAIAFKNGVPPKDLTPELLASFCSYWSVRPEREQTQAQWEYQLVQHLHHLRTQSAARENPPHGNPRSGQSFRSGAGQQRRASAVDRVEAQIAKQRAERAQASSPAAHGASGKPLADYDADLRPPLDVEFWRVSES